MHKKWLLIVALATIGLLGGVAPAANAQSIWGNGSPVSGSAQNQTVFRVGSAMTVRCTVVVNAGGVIGPVMSAPFNVQYTNCVATVGGVSFAATVTGGNPSIWDVNGASFNPTTGVWSGSTVTRTSPLTITVAGTPCVVQIPAGTVLTTNGTNSGTPSGWTGTSMNMSSTTVPFTASGCPGVPPTGTNGTVIIIIIVVNWWDP